MQGEQRAQPEGSAWAGFLLALRAFARVPNSWLVLARNLVPVVGVFFLGWSAQLTIFSYWWDGVSLFAALITAIVLRVAADLSKQLSLAQRVLQGVFGWIIVFGLLGIPFWIALNALELGSAFYEVIHDPARTIAFLAIFAGNAYSGPHRGFLTLDDAEVKRRAQAGLHTLIVRAVLMMLMWEWGRGFLLVPGMAVVLTATEAWPGVLAEIARIKRAERARRPE